ncbi:hypothetical protein HRR83_001682 [Exophiala dermatitidis]|nr:hypothetical protein HRR73_004816 [Exophiala dermatitidis]KAJ4526488.1 hypothetical protein HRR74_001686 [Exophiala dermatitidis]KAJ4532266.1 hypothetical protein HRR76_007264 [Exophiala dermatitidis]KAJ4546303.1 hypothetical protein HRR77_004838 [Exophiala dermatitidis]KAJ4567455.1 hypothetical protein HRR79_004970 [Exophiala dermatitidis]
MISPTSLLTTVYLKWLWGVIAQVWNSPRWPSQQFSACLTAFSGPRALLAFLCTHGIVIGTSIRLLVGRGHYGSNVKMEAKTILPLSEEASSYYENGKTRSLSWITPSSENHTPAS